MAGPDKEQLPHLLKLLDDEAPEVRSGVAKGLAAFGAELRPALGSVPGGEALWPQVKAVLGDWRRERLYQRWPAWLELEDETRRLETGLEILSTFIGGRPAEGGVGERLDALAEEYRHTAEKTGPKSLAAFLFQVRGLVGADSNEYYKPANSDLASVIDKKRGLPVTLACVYQLIGARVGIEVRGCNFPGHFLAKVEEEDQTLLVDCFHGGRFFREKDLLKTHKGPPEALRQLIEKPADSETVLRRVLRTLVGSYEKSEEIENRRIISDLLAAMEARRKP